MREAGLRSFIQLILRWEPSNCFESQLKQQGSEKVSHLALYQHDSRIGWYRKKRERRTLYFGIVCGGPCLFTSEYTQRLD